MPAALLLNQPMSDGAAVFALFIVGFLAVVIFLMVEVAFRPPSWVHFIYQPPIVIALSIACLRPLKGLLFALQFKHDAHEARLDD